MGLLFLTSDLLSPEDNLHSLFPLSKCLSLLFSLAWLFPFPRVLGQMSPPQKAVVASRGNKKGFGDTPSLLTFSPPPGKLTV